MKLVRVVLTFVVERDKYMSLISNILDKFGISATLAQADDFEKWLVNEVWKKYSEEKNSCHYSIVANTGTHSLAECEGYKSIAANTGAYSMAIAKNTKCETVSLQILVSNQYLKIKENFLYQQTLGSTLQQQAMVSILLQ